MFDLNGLKLNVVIRDKISKLGCCSLDARRQIFFVGAVLLWSCRAGYDWAYESDFGARNSVLPHIQDMRVARLVGSLKPEVSFAKEPYKRDDILQKKPVILRSLLIIVTP